MTSQAIQLDTPLERLPLPSFSTIEPSQIESQLDTHLQNYRACLEQHLQQPFELVSWQGCIQPLEQLQNSLSLFWSPIRHLNSVKSTTELRQAHDACQVKLSAFYTELGQHEGLCALYHRVKDEAWDSLSQPQRQAVQQALRDFKLSGVDLSEEDKESYRQLKEKLSKLSTQFSNHVLDATDHWALVSNEEEALEGIPAADVARFKAKAEEKGEKGWHIGLDFPSYYAVITYAQDRNLRERLYYAYVTRASDQGPEANKYDNSKIMAQTVQLKQQLAKLCGYDSYAAYSLATKMANSPEEVTDFLTALLATVRPKAVGQFKELGEFAKAHDGLEKLEPWDVGYYSNLLKEANYSFSPELLKPYFELDQVLSGLFSVVETLYGIQILSLTDVDTWHEDVRAYEVQSQGESLAVFYGDFMARPQKRGGAWMDDHAGRFVMQGVGTQFPIAYLTCNFTPKGNDTPCLLTMDEVTTLFHEFGHGLHHMMTKIDELSVSGINGVPWDAVELPSQFMENWCWQKESLQRFAKHYQTGEAIPDGLLDKAIAAKNFQSGLFVNRQLEFALFDFNLHEESDFSGDSEHIQQLLDRVREQVSVINNKNYNRFQHSFSHIFAGGYAAGYYSYLWAEVLACDAFGRFEEEGIFNTETGQAFLDKLLSQGGSKEAMDLFVDFRGRKPELSSFLRSSGLAD